MMNKWMPLLLGCIVFPLCPANAGDLNMVFIPKSRDQDFWTFIRQGVDRAAREVGPVQLTARTGP
jgi:ribose transport system substrate-binding protein